MYFTFFKFVLARFCVGGPFNLTMKKKKANCLVHNHASNTEKADNSRAAKWQRLCMGNIFTGANIACSGGVYFGRAKTACLCSYCCSHHLWCYDGDRLQEYSRPPIIRAFKGNRKKFELSWVRVIEGKIIMIENDLKGNQNCFELTGGSSYRGFELPGVDCSKR